MSRRARYSQLRRRLAPLLALMALAAGASGCITRPIKEQVFQEEGTRVFLRSYKRGVTPVDQHYQHPVTVSPVRMAHILSRIDLRRGEDSERVPAVPLELLYTMAAGMTDAFAQAGPNQEVLVQAQRRAKSLLVFDHFFLTSLMAYVRDDLMYIHISHSDRKIEKRGRQTTGLPETHVGKYPFDFRLIVDRGMTLNDHQSVAVAWRDDIFRKPTRTRVTSTGRVVRREVLMESFEDESIELKTPSMPAQLSPEQLRALADLEEDRQNGELSETQYQSRRGRILRGEPASP